MAARNVEEVPLQSWPKQQRADPTADVRAYHARKRLIIMRTSLFLAPLAALAALRNPIAGIALVLGGVLGVLNMLATMRENERLLEGRRSRAMFALNAQVRIFAVGIIPVAVALRLAAFWTLGFALAAFFTPLALYALELRRAMRQGT
ncbi:MAG: hypothetical protein JOZ24_03775 [Candidatus Eremiobacteraeota bacterium]|nr:hypothetical protein [Candidatus Eremiobacteraeota bacterium]